MKRRFKMVIGIYAVLPAAVIAVAFIAGMVMVFVILWRLGPDGEKIGGIR